VLVTLDTTRADRIGAYGYANARTAAVDGFAQEGVRFARAYATVPLTTPSHASMLTGLYPARHGIHGNGDATLHADTTTVTAHLQAAGWHTAASVSAFVTTRVWGLDQGFDAYFDDVQRAGQAAGPRAGRWGQERPADAVVDDLEGWLGEVPSGEPFFIWAHFYDPHHPHTPPAGFDQADPYDGEIAFMDAQIARLQRIVEDAAGPTGAAWIVVADHGEAFAGEHGESSHGLFLFDPTVRIPFIVRPAAPLDGPLVVTTSAVSGVDVAPTALSLVGLPIPLGLDGVDLTPALAGRPLNRAPVVMEADAARQRFGFATERAAVSGPYKLMDTPSPRLFNVDTDPSEATNILPSHRAEAAELRHAISAAATSPGPAPTGTIGVEVAEQLASLGYVQHDLGGPATGEDAKDHLTLIAALDAARAPDQPPEETEARLQALLAEHPNLGEALLALSRAQGRQGHLREAEATLQRGLSTNPDSTVLRLNLANNLAAQGRHAESLASAERVLTQVEGDRQAQDTVLRILADQGRHDEVVRRGAVFRATSPDDAGLAARMGVSLVALGQPTGARRLLEESLSDGVPRRHVQRAMGLLTLAEGDAPGAVLWLQRESDAFPGDASVRWELGNALMSLRRWDEAAAEYAALVQLQPRDPSARRAWAQATFNAGGFEEAAEILAPALAVAPDDPDVLLLHANILSRQGRKVEAEAIHTEATALRERSIRARSTRPGGVSRGPQGR
jgi:arylsulfatase A-like enzyme/Flp pilus assembly protein TadD